MIWPKGHLINMEITDINPGIQYIQQNGKTNDLDKSQNSSAEKNQFSAEDKVDLSAESKEMKKIKDILATTPDVRTEKVAELKKLVESGQYEIKSDTVADKMVKDSIWEINR